MLDQIIFYFLLCLGLGSFFSYGFVRPEQVGPSFFRYHGWGTLIAMALAFYFRPIWFEINPVWLTVSLLAMVAISIGKLAATLNAVAAVVSLVTGLLFLGVGRITVAPLLGVPEISSALVGLNLTLVALVLGFSMTAMWLGHWYLTQPKLSIDELKRVTLILAALLAIRLLVACVTVLPRLPGSELELYRFFATSAGIFLLMRSAWGLIVPLVFVWMVWKTVQIRSTQSATGILYVLLLSILAGETLSLYLMFHDGWIA